MNTPRAVVISLFLLALALAALYGCSKVRVRHSPHYTVKMKRAALARTVRVRTDSPGCRGWGSGTIIAPHLILTAYHVVKCQPEGALVTWGEDGVSRVLTEVHEESMDVAVLYVEDVMLDERVPFGPKPLLGDGVCMYPARDVREPHCGATMAHLFGWGERRQMDIMALLPVVPGDSGSAVYDRKGRLVGVIIASLRGSEIVGFATSLENKLIHNPNRN